MTIRFGPDSAGSTFVSLQSAARRRALLELRSMSTQPSTDVDITGGSISGSCIASSAVSFTGGSITGTCIASSFVDLSGGKINGIPIGATNASSGNFTALDASSNFTGVHIGLTSGLNATTGTFTGGMTASSGAFTNGISASSAAFTNGITASSGAFTAGITASSATFTNTVAMNKWAATSGVSGTSAAFTNGISASSAAFTNGISASSAAFTIMTGILGTTAIASSAVITNPIIQSPSTLLGVDVVLQNRAADGYFSITAFNQGSTKMWRIGQLGGANAFNVYMTSADTLVASFTTASLALSSGMTATTGTFSGGITASSAAFTNGMTASSATFTNTVAVNKLAATSGVSASSAAFTNGISASSAAFTNGISASSAAFTNGITASSGAFGTLSVTGLTSGYLVLTSTGGALVALNGIQSIRVRNTTATTGIVSATETVLTMTASVVDGGTIFSTATGRITPKKPGVYLWTASAYLSGTFTTGSNVQCQIRKSGVVDAVGLVHIAAAGDTPNPRCTSIFAMTTSEYVEMWVAGTVSAGTVTAKTDAALSYLSGAWVSS